MKMVIPGSPTGSTRKAAIYYTLGRVKTSHLFLHGTSAGSAGVFSVAYAMEHTNHPAYGKVRVNGIVNDSGVVGPAMQDVINQVEKTTPNECTYHTEPTPGALVALKIGPLVGDSFYSPGALVARGEATFPIMHVWSHGDYECCGDKPFAFTGANGQAFTMAPCDYNHQELADAIDAKNASHDPAAPFQNLRVCVGRLPSEVSDPVQNPKRPCDRHTSTIYHYTKNDPQGDTEAGHELDYNNHILTWVKQRLLDPPAVTH